MKVKINFLMCDYDEAFTRTEMYEETNLCINCKYILCPSHLLAARRNNYKEN